MNLILNSLTWGGCFTGISFIIFTLIKIKRETKVIYAEPNPFMLHTEIILFIFLAMLMLIKFHSETKNIKEETKWFSKENNLTKKK